MGIPRHWSASAASGSKRLNRKPRCYGFAAGNRHLQEDPSPSRSGRSHVPGFFLVTIEAGVVPERGSRWRVPEVV